MNDKNCSFEFAVIGGGSAGYAAARTAASLGLSTAVIDGAETLGGLCILRGCMPSKTLIESANRALDIRRAAEFGLRARAGAPNLPAIRERKRALIEDFSSYRRGQLEGGAFTLLRGRARFLTPNAMELTDHYGGTRRVEFKTACIATGSEVNVIPLPGLQECGFWTSDDVLDADALPDSFIVLGGGAIALEMAHYLEAMGRKVTLIQRSQGLLKNMDPECGTAVAEAFRKRGIAVHCGTAIQKAEKSAGGKVITFSSASGIQTVEAAEILVATGRSPATAGLGLAEIGMTCEGGKILVADTLQTSLPHLFAAGDVCSPVDVVHLAIQQGEIAAHNAAAVLRGEAPPQRTDYRLTLFGIFCEPQAACVGATEADLTKASVPHVSATHLFSDHGKSMVMGATEGFVKLIVHQHTGEILGASVVGPEATEIIHEIVVAMAFRATAAQFLAIPHYHPTLSEIWTYPAEDLAHLGPA